MASADLPGCERFANPPFLFSRVVVFCTRKTLSFSSLNIGVSLGGGIVPIKFENGRRCQAALKSCMSISEKY